MSKYVDRDATGATNATSSFSKILKRSAVMGDANDDNCKVIDEVNNNICDNLNTFIDDSVNDNASDDANDNVNDNTNVDVSVIAGEVDKNRMNVMKDS